MKDRIDQVRCPIRLARSHYFGIPVLEKFMVNVNCTVDSPAFRNIAHLEMAAIVAEEESPVEPCAGAIRRSESRLLIGLIAIKQAVLLTATSFCRTSWPGHSRRRARRSRTDRRLLPYCCG